jgi:hypothetical protein
MKLVIISKNFKKFKDICRNSYKKFKSFFDEEDKKAVLDFTRDVVMSGLSINTILAFLGIIPFTWYSFIFIGLFWRFIKREVITNLRRLWFRN